MKAIVVVDSNWGIAKNGKLLFHIKKDLKRFKEITEGRVVVMGRKTFESLPGKKPLSNRTNIIVTRNKNYKVDGGIVVNSIQELKKELNKYFSEDVYLIGGAELYKELLNECSDVVVTYVHKDYKADKFFHNLSNDKNWEEWLATSKGNSIQTESYYDEVEDVEYDFLVYRNLKMY